MDKLTAIKIKNPDGSYSDPIYISVDAANVKYNTVQNIKDIVNSLSARISAIASLEEGSTTGDAQLIDARIGFDGETYSNAGEAIRANDRKNAQLINNISESTYNIFYFTNQKNRTVSGVTITFNVDGTVTFNGTASGVIRFGLMGDSDFSTQNVTTGKTYSVYRELMSGSSSGSAPNPFFFTRNIEASSGDTTITLNQPLTIANNITIGLKIQKDTVFNNVTYRFMIKEGQPDVYIKPFTASDKDARKKIENILSIIAEDYNENENYDIGDCVLYNDKFYKCNTTIDTSESWTSAHWDQVTISNELDKIEEKAQENVQILKNDLYNINDWLFKDLGVFNYNFEYGRIPTTTTSVDPTNIVDTENVKHAIISCVEGDTFTITCVNVTSSYRPYTFIDDENNVLLQATGNSFVDKEIVAPQNSTKLVLNSNKSQAGEWTCYCKKGASRIEALETNLEELENKFTSLGDAGYKQYAINWDEISSGNFSYGWRTGYWDDTGVRTSSNTNIMTVGKLASFEGAHPVLNHGLFAKVELPLEKTIVIKAIDKTNNTLIKRVDLVSGETFEVIPDCYYTFHMKGTESDITESFVNSIVITVFYKITAKKPYTLKYERFLVSVNSKWPDYLNTTTNNTETEPDLNIRSIITLPDTYTPDGDPTPLIMICHGYNGYISDNYWNSNGESFLAMVNAFRSAGYAVFDVDNTRANTNGYGDWGSLPIMSAYIKAWEYIKKTYNVENRLFLYSYSMGTTAALNMLKWYGNQIVTSVQAACRPICQIRYEALADTDTRKKQIAIAFGLCSEEDTESEEWVAPQWETERLKGFNQYEERVNINGTDIINMKVPPVKVLIGENDNEFQTEAIAYYTALKNNGNFVNMRIVSGMNHADMGYLNNANLREETVRWFNRFK